MLIEPNIIKINLYCAAKLRSILRGAGHCTSAKRMTSILRPFAEAFPPARQETIPNSHRVIGIATNYYTSMVLNCALVTYLMMTADVVLPDAVLCHTQDARMYLFYFILAERQLLLFAILKLVMSSGLIEMYAFFGSTQISYLFYLVSLHKHV